MGYFDAGATPRRRTNDARFRGSTRKRPRRRTSIPMIIRYRMSRRSVIVSWTRKVRPAMTIEARTTSRRSGISAAALRIRTCPTTGPRPSRLANRVSRLVRAAPVSTFARTGKLPLRPRTSTASTMPIVFLSAVGLAGGECCIRMIPFRVGIVRGDMRLLPAPSRDTFFPKDRAARVDEGGGG